MTDLKAVLGQKPIIAAVKDDQGLEQALRTGCPVIFMLFGTVCNIDQLVSAVKKAGKLVFVHADLIDGLASREVAVEFIKDCGADGIISTKPAIIKYARERGLLTVHRFFVIDSMALTNVMKYMATGGADMIEIMPATMPKIIGKITKVCRVPVIAGGLISDAEDVSLALKAGAAAVSTTDAEIWKL